MILLTLRSDTLELKHCINSSFTCITVILLPIEMSCGQYLQTLRQLQHGVHRQRIVGHVPQLLVLGGHDLARVLDRRNFLRVGSRNLEPAQNSGKAGGRPVRRALEPEGLQG